MKNLFDYATRELAQDALLTWLFSNYDCEKPKVCEVAYHLLNKFNGLDMKLGEATHLKVVKQYKKMDIIVRFNYGGKRYLTVIEDKTYSREHDNQLQKYNSELEKIQDVDVIKRIYYKTDDKDPQDIKACDECQPEWKYYFIEDIVKLFDGFHDTGSHILDDYISHVRAIERKVSHMSKKSMTEWDYYEFRTYFRKMLLPQVGDLHGAMVKYPGWYGYPSVVIEYSANGKNYCSLEIIGRIEAEGFSYILRAGEWKADKNGKFVESELLYEKRKEISKHFCDDHSKDRFISRVRKDWKWAIAGSKSPCPRNLSYDQPLADVTEELKATILDFIDRCGAAL